MFYGSHEFLMDEKGRVSIPSQFVRLMKPEDQDTFVMTRGLNGCIFCFPYTSFEHYTRAMRRLKLPTAERLKVMRIILAWATNCTLDSQRRVKIPPRLAKHAGLGREVMIVGHQDRIEIWNRAKYEEYHGVAELGGEAYDYDSAASIVFVDMMPGADQSDREEEPEPPDD